MMYHQKPIEEFVLNELNKKNTFEDSGVVEFYNQGHKFGLGFWTTSDEGVGDTYGDSPFSCLIAWTPKGWVLLHKLSPIWGDDLGMNMFDEEEDLEVYMWFAADQFNQPMRDFINQAGGSEVPEKQWQKVLALYRTVRINDAGFIEFDGTL